MFRRLLTTSFRASQRQVFCNNLRIAAPVVSQQQRFYSEGKPAQTSFLDRSDVESRVIDIVKKHDKVAGSDVDVNTSFVKDLGLDSLDAAEIVMAVEDEFSVQIPDEEAFKFLSVPEVVEYIVNHPMAK